MKKINPMAILIAAVLTLCFTFTSCGKDDEKENDIYTGVITGNIDVATAVSGTYTGKRTIGTTVVSDAYIVRISRLTSPSVHVSADFYSSGSANYNVSLQGNIYVFSNETDPNISITVTGKTLNINYLTVGGYMMTYTGIKD